MKKIVIAFAFALSITACGASQNDTDTASAQQNSGIITSMQAVYADIATAHTVTLSAFSLSPRGRMAYALEEAARRGANVSVALDGQAFGAAEYENHSLAPVLQGIGVHVHYSVGPSHLKALVTDGTRTYLSDRNWTSTGQNEIVLLDPYAGDRILVERAMLGYGGSNDHLWLVKRDALHAEATMLSTRTSSHVDVQTESFGAGTEVYDAILDRFHQGDHVRLIIATTEYNQTPRERETVEKLQQQGIQVKLSPTDEKIAIEGTRSWVGSANLTRGLPEQIDFGFIFTNPSITAQLQTEFDKNWDRGVTPQ